ncbi:MAG TPA: ABC transporter ATP-binding protein [Burkholderiales bacterium]|nr:ABC transporter ATP-binding protein [Burkholderiales bacterium]
MMLHVESLQVRIGDRVLVSSLDLAIRKGERWGVLGRNGAGKSTLLHVLAGLRPPDAGRVMIDGRPVQQLARREAARHVGILLQEETRDYWGSARDYAMLGRYPHQRGMFGPGTADRDVVDRALADMDLAAIASRAYRSLSGGERQRARLAALLAQQPDFYLCDEPLQQLDLPHQIAFLDRLGDESRHRCSASLMVLHDLVFASRYCDYLLLLFGDGRCAQGSREEMMTQDNLRALYGFPLEVRTVDGEFVFLPARSGSVTQL